MIKKLQKNKRLSTSILMLITLSLIAIIDNILVIWLFLGTLFYLSVKELRSFHDNNCFIFSDIFMIVVWGSILFFKIEPLLIFFGIFAAGLMAYNNKIKNQDFLIVIYPTIGIAYTFYLYKDFGIEYLGLLVLIVSLTDSVAYFVGRTFGKNKLSTTSPNKTLEGAFGGVAVATIISSVFAVQLLDNIYYSLLVSLVVSISSVFGDLYESLLKRNACVKDSGCILPGHGGILDRIDGYLFAAPILYLLIKLI